MALRQQGQHSYGDSQSDIRDRLLTYSTKNGYPAEYFGDAVCACGSRLFRLLLDETEGATAHLEVEALPEKLRRQIVDRRDGYERSLRALVARGVKRGEFAPCDVALVTRAMLGAVNWTARWYRPDGAQTVAEIAKALPDYLVRGLVVAARKPTKQTDKKRAKSC